VITAPTTGPVDWNGDGNFTAIHATSDVDALVGCAANPADKLSGFADWPDLCAVPPGSPSTGARNLRIALQRHPDPRPVRCI
jgi:hypothetical protein